MGCGRVGATLAQSLEHRGHSVAVIDQNPDAFRRLDPEFTGKRVTGLGFDRQTLVQAGIEDAYAFAAVSDGDNSNILSARVARETYGVDNVVARIYDPHRAEIYQRLGIPTVATVRWTADQVLRRLLPMGATDEYRDASGQVVMAQVDLHPAWAGRPLRTLEAASGARVAYVTRYGDGVLPTPTTVIQENDLVHVLVLATDRPGRTDLHRAAGGAALMRVVIAGAGSVGRSIARELLAARARGHPRSTSQPVRHAGRLGRRRRVAARRRVRAPALRQARTETCDVVVAATGDDKVNLVVSLLSKTEFGVPRTVARVNNPRNEWIFDEAWGVDVAVSTPRIMTAMVEEAVAIGDLVKIFTFHQSRADILELTLPADSPLVGVRSVDVHWPADTVLAALVRDTPPIAPTADDTLEGRRRAALRRGAGRGRDRALHELLVTHGPAPR